MRQRRDGGRDASEGEFMFLHNVVKLHENVMTIRPNIKGAAHTRRQKKRIRSSIFVFQ